MLRRLVLLLLLANLLFLAWGQGWLDSLTGTRAHAGREPERLARQVRPQLITVLPPASAAATAASAPTTVAAATPVCLEAGPFATGASVSAMATLQALQPPLPAGSWVEVTIERPGAWLVYIARPANREAAAKKEEELKRTRVAFEPVISPAELAGGWSLGRYDDRAAADKALEQFGQRGIRTAKVVELAPAATVHMLRADKADKALATQLSALRSDTLGRGFVPCGS